jgi:hypothetical protein
VIYFADNDAGGNYDDYGFNTGNESPWEVVGTLSGNSTSMSVTIIPGAGNMFFRLAHP